MFEAFSSTVIHPYKSTSFIIIKNIYVQQDKSYSTIFENW